MSRPYHPLTFDILNLLNQKKDLGFDELYKLSGKNSLYKEFYNALYRLAASDLIKKERVSGNLYAQITTEGKTLLARMRPEKDGVWKLVIFDIPEKHKKIRGILRTKLKQLNFKKWQNSIYVSPYILADDIEAELNELGKKFFVRLIKTTDVNYTEDLDKLFG